MRELKNGELEGKRQPPKRPSPKRTAPAAPARGSTSLSRVASLVLLVGLLVFFIWAIHNWMLNSNAFVLQKIDIHGNRILTDEEIRAQLKIGRGIRLTDVELGKIEKRLRQIPFVRTVLVSRRFPTTLDVEIEERVPVAYILGRKKMWMVDEEGVILPSLRGSRALDLPVIVGMKNFTERATATIQDPKILQAVWLLATTRALDKNLFYTIDNVTYSQSRGVVVYLMKPSLPLYFGKDLTVRQIEYVKAILEKLKRERRLTSTRYIDLRFDKQVVVG